MGAMMTKNCVEILEISTVYCELGYENCQETATHYIQLELVALGESQAWGKFCRNCADEYAADLKASLPDDPPASAV